MTHPFLTEWAEWARQLRDEPPYQFPGDEDALRGLRQDGALTCDYRSWDEYIKSPHFDEADDTRFHLELLPHPFAGDPAEARIVILALNPGLSLGDHFGELTQDDFRNALLATLRRDTDNGGFMFLDPRFSWHPGFRYWHSKLRQVIATLATCWGTNVTEARERFRRQMATIELVPYHSVKFKFQSQLMRMQSVQLARRFVNEILVPRANKGECLLIVTRAARIWGLAASKHTVVYSGTEAQSAHLTPASQGGKRIIPFLSGTRTPRCPQDAPH